MSDAPDPYDQFDPDKDAGPTPAQTQAREPDDPYDQFGPKISGWTKPPDESSATGAFIHGGERSVLPAAGGLAGAGAGAETGAAIGGGFGALFGGVGAAPGAFVGGLVGGVGGFFGGSYLTGKAQDYALTRAPDSWTEALGQSDRQQKLDQEQHPYASFLGGLAPYALTMTPFGAATKLPADATALQRILANPMTARVFGGAAMGGMELGQEKVEGQPTDWGKVAIATGFGVVFNRQNRIGETITGAGARTVQPVAAAIRNTANAAVFARTLDAAEPTIAQAGDLKVMAPGVTESVFRGTQEMDPEAEKTAQDAARNEQMAIGPYPSSSWSLHDVARRMEPELFDRYDALQQRVQTFRDQIAALNNPSDESFAALDEREAQLQKDLAAVPYGQGGESPEVRRVRALITDVRQQRETLTSRREGSRVETPELAAVRQHLLATDFELRDVGRDVAAAYRRAADRTGAEVVEPEAPVSEAVESGSTAQNNEVPSAAKTESEETVGVADEGAQGTKETIGTPAFDIAADVRQKLVAAGRPDEEAQAAGKIASALYETHAARLGNSTGNSAQEIYQREAPGVEVSERLKKAFGKLTPTGIIRLARDAHAGTFIHETGHDWLNRILRDADHPDAVDSLKSDAAAIRDWLGTKEAPTRAQHEKFANAFERYLFEGTAPSAKLAGVFGKFKGWLSDTYRTIKGAVQPKDISEDIRGVFDRMLAETPQRTVIAPERPGGPTLADIHTADAAETEPAEAGSAATRIDAERARAATEPPVEIAHEIAPAVAEIEAERAAANPAGEPGAGEPGRSEVEPSGGEAGAQPGGGGVGASASDERAGVNAPVAEGAGLRGGSGQSSSAAAGQQTSAGGPKSQPLAPRPAESFGPRETRTVDLAGNIRVENLSNAADIVQALHESADRNDDFRDVRGEMTRGQIDALADSMGLDAGSIDAATLQRVFGGTTDLAGKILAARRLVVQSARIVSDAMSAAADSDDPAALATFAQAVTRHDLIQSTLSGVTAEWGRAGTAFHSLLDDWGKAQDVGQLLKENTGRDLYQLKRMAQLGKSYDTPGKVSKFLRDYKKRSFGRMLLEYWINGLISGTATHSTYFVGNQILEAWRTGPETLAAAAIGRAMEAAGRVGDGKRVYAGEAGVGLKTMVTSIPKSLQAAGEAFKTGQVTLLPDEPARPLPVFGTEALPQAPRIAKTSTNEDVTWNEVNANLFGALTGFKEGLRAGAELVTSGEGGFGVRWSQHGQNPDFTWNGANALPLGTLVRLPSRFVAAIHSFFRVSNYSVLKAQNAHRVATSEGLTGTAFAARIAEKNQNPSPEEMEGFRKGANDATLMGAGGQFVQKLSAITNWAPDLPLLGETPILKFVDPFVHIAANIVDQSIVQRTPVGLLSRELRADIMGKNGNVAQDTAMARMLVGTGMAVTFGGLAAQGLVSGSGPSDPHKAAIWRMAGNQASSVRIGDVWYDVHRLGPLGMLLGISADLYDVAHAAQTDGMLAAGSSLMHAFTQNILDESFMKGPADLIQALEDHDRYGERYIQNFLSSFVPFSVGMAQMDRASDPYTREARTVMDSVRQKVPGLSESLFPRRDIWGEPLPNHDALVARGLTAVYETQVSRDPVNLAMAALNMGPAPVERKIRNIKLTDGQYDDFARLAGRMTKMRLDAIVRSPDWQTWPATIRRDVITETIRQTRAAATGVMMMKNPSIPAAAVQAKRSKAQ